MKRILSLTLSLVACLALPACAGLGRTSITQHANYGPQTGKRVQPLHGRLFWGLFDFNVAEVNTGLHNRDDSDVAAGGSSIGDKTALSNLVASASSERKGSNVVDKVGYKATGFETDVSEQTPKIVESITKGVVDGLKKVP